MCCLVEVRTTDRVLGNRRSLVLPRLLLQPSGGVGPLKGGHGSDGTKSVYEALTYNHLVIVENSVPQQISNSPLHAVFRALHLMMFAETY